MNQEKIGAFIKDIRKKNNLTQKELADKYGVTYQAVSKWENGKNLPDISLIRQMSKDFNVSIEDILDGEENKNKKSKIIILTIILLVVGVGLFFAFNNRDDSYEFKTISSSCKEYEISGSIAYDKNKSSIYISNINYCGKDKNIKYDRIECILYEVNNEEEIEIDNYKHNGNSITLDEFLKDVRFHIDKYDSICKKYNENSIYILVKASNDDKEYSKKVYLSLDDSCKK